MIGELHSVVLDARDPHALASFYSELLGWPVVRVDGDWIDIGDGQGRQLSFQHAPDHQPPRWPDPAFPQQAHLDIGVQDIDTADGAGPGPRRDSAAQQRARIPGVRRPGGPPLLPHLGLARTGPRVESSGRAATVRAVGIDMCKGTWQPAHMF